MQSFYEWTPFASGSAAYLVRGSTIFVYYFQEINSDGFGVI